ncbi:hypothetical protein WA538_000874 [Blastocystis sp. DL]
MNCDSTILAINEFILQTTSFMNEFLQTCESKLNRLNNRVIELEAATSLLETKINGVQQEIYCNKGVQFLEKLQGKGEMEDSLPSPSRTSTSKPVATPSQIPPLPTNPPPLPSSTSQVRWKDHPVYRKYFKLLQMGMPVEHVRSKMQMDGLDENLIDNNPDVFVPEEYM